MNSSRVSGAVSVVFLAAVSGSHVGIDAASPPRVEWQDTYGGENGDGAASVRQTADGGYIAAGSTASSGAGGADVYLVKTDAVGGLLWAKTFGGATDDTGSAVRQTGDGGYVVLGNTFVMGNGPFDIYLVRTDADGDLLWERNLGGERNDFSGSIEPTGDGGFIITGWTASFGAGNDDVYLAKLDGNGDSVWERIYGGPNADVREIGVDVDLTADGGYVVAGTEFRAGRRSVYLQRNDPAGDLLWVKTFGGDRSVGSSVEPTADGGFAVLGSTTLTGAGGADMYLVRTDGSGNVLWERTFGGVGDDQGVSIAPAPGGGYFLAGWTLSFGAGGVDGYVVGTDRNGHQRWELPLGGEGEDALFAAHAVGGGGYIVAGNTASFDAAGADVYLVKLIPAAISTAPVPALSARGAALAAVFLVAAGSLLLFRRSGKPAAPA